MISLILVQQCNASFKVLLQRSFYTGEPHTFVQYDLQRRNNRAEVHTTVSLKKVFSAPGQSRHFSSHQVIENIVSKINTIARVIDPAVAQPISPRGNSIKWNPKAVHHSSSTLTFAFLLPPLKCFFPFSVFRSAGSIFISRATIDLCFRPLKCFPDAIPCSLYL